MEVYILIDRTEGINRIVGVYDDELLAMKGKAYFEGANKGNIYSYDNYHVQQGKYD